MLRMDGRTHGRTDASMDGGLDGRMDGWMDRQIQADRSEQTTRHKQHEHNNSEKQRQTIAAIFRRTGIAVGPRS